MRILKLQFQNLNSLQGQWEIDFTAKDYLCDGIFAITGATGAGKSTILDAISVALYGRTPRLKSIAKSSNEILSRGCGECYSKVLFEVGGEEYLASWSQKRAGGKAHGNLQDVRHFLDEGKTGKNICDKIRDTREEIEKKVGMNFDQFTRSMLLAQGEFAKFLQAKSDERAAILEKITNTEKYSDISKAVHIRKREEGNILERLKQGAESYTLLNTTDVEKLNSEIGELSFNIDQLGVKEKSLNESLAIQHRMAELENEYVNIEKELTDITAREQDFVSGRERLRLGGLVAQIWAEYRLLSQLRADQEKSMLTLKELKELVPAKESALEKSLKTHQERNEELKSLREQHSVQEELIKQVLALDMELKGFNNTYYQKKQETEELLSKIASCRNEMKETNTLNLGYVQRLESIQSFMQENVVDEKIGRDYKMIQEKFFSIESLKDEIAGFDEKIYTFLEKFEKSKSCFVQVSDEYEIINAGHEKAVLEEIRLTELLADKNGGRDISELLVRLEENQQLLSDYKNIKAKYTDHVSAKEDCQKFDAEILALNNVCRLLRDELDELNAEKEVLAAEVDHLGLEVRQAERIMTLQEQRGRLKDGEPCPLCGALEHPFATKELPSSEELTSKLIEAKSELGIIDSEIGKLTKRLVEKERDCENCEHLRQDKQQLLASLLQELEPELAKIGLAVDSISIVETLEKNLVELQLSIDNMRSVVVEVEQISKQLNDCRNTVGVYKEQLVTSCAEMSEKREAYQLSQSNYSRVVLDADKVKREFDGFVRDVADSLAVFGMYEIRDITDNTVEILLELQERDQRWRSIIIEKSGIEKKIAEAESVICRSEDRIGDWTKHREKIQDELFILADEINNLENRRFALYADKQIEDVQQQFSTMINIAEEKSISSQKNVDISRDELIGVNERINSCEQDILHRELELSNAQSRFVEEYTARGFACEEEFVDARLEDQELLDLKIIDDELRALEQGTKVKLDENRKEYKKHESNNQFDTEVEVLKSELAEVSKHRAGLTEEVGSLKQQLDNDEKMRQLLHDKIVEIELQEEEYERWSILHNLIGSENGQKYRNFAQGLTFDIMLKYANVELIKMSERYLLVRSKVENGANKELLELDVIDKYQGDQRRSTKNLSGGESFIVSLALALGLSRMSSKKVQVNSLFLDEGFGTLDPDSLDAILSALSRLQQDGKLIGIISHVPELKERINTQIVIEAVSEGRSIVTGVGCKRIG